ncbi:MAG: hypothetical protein DRQ44_18120, partial [Gammaproteobacteria bacterium]
TNETFTQQDIIDGNVSYSHDGTNTTSDSFSYSVADPVGNTLAAQTFSITVTAADNDTATVVNQSVTVAEGASNVVLTAADISSTDLDTTDATLIYTVGNVSNGSLSINGSAWAAGTNETFTQQDIIDGNVSYSHDGTETISDSFSYSVADAAGNTLAAQTFSITVTAVNDAPVITANTNTIVDEGNTVNIDLVANYTDVDNAVNLNGVNIINPPANGGIVLYANGTVDYIHDGSETISDSFSYTVTDIDGGVSNIAIVNITINPVNDTPTTTGIIDVSVAEDSASTSIDLNAAFNDTDNPDSDLTYSITGNTGIGLFSSTAVNAVTGELELYYAADMNGSSQISVRATDLDGEFVESLFTVTVTPVNDAPVLVNNSGVTVLGTNTTVISSAELSVDDTEDDNGTIVYTITALPVNGFLTLNGAIVTLSTSFTEADILNNNLSYQFNGSGSNDRFEFTITDSNGGAVSGNSFNIAVNITPPEPETVVITAPVPDIFPDTPETEGASGNSSNASAESLEEVKEIEDWYAGSTATDNTSTKTRLTVGPGPRVELEQTRDELKTIEESLVEDKKAEINFSQSSGVADIQMKSIKALWTSIDLIKQQIDENVSENISNVEFRAAAVSSSGVALTAGVVAWILRGGALMSSLISTIPLWKGYDPLPILAYKDEDEDEDEEDVVEENIPTSLEEMRKNRELKERMKKYNQVDGMFDGMGT